MNGRTWEAEIALSMSPCGSGSTVRSLGGGRQLSANHCRSTVQSSLPKRTFAFARGEAALCCQSSALHVQGGIRNSALMMVGAKATGNGKSGKARQQPKTAHRGC